MLEEVEVWKKNVILHITVKGFLHGLNIILAKFFVLCGNWKLRYTLQWQFCFNYTFSSAFFCVPEKLVTEQSILKLNM